MQVSGDVGPSGEAALIYTSLRCTARRAVFCHQLKERKLSYFCQYDIFALL